MRVIARVVDLWEDELMTTTTPAEFQTLCEANGLSFDAVVDACTWATDAEYGVEHRYLSALTSSHMDVWPEAPELKRGDIVWLPGLGFKKVMAAGPKQLTVTMRGTDGDWYTKGHNMSAKSASLQGGVVIPEGKLQAALDAQRAVYEAYCGKEYWRGFELAYALRVRAAILTALQPAG